MNSKDIAKLLSLIANPIRVEIIKFLDNEQRSFSSIMKELSLDSTSKLSFHLEKLAYLIHKNESGLYGLTPLGEKLYVLLLKFENGEIEIVKENTNISIGEQASKFTFRKDFLLLTCLTLLVGVLNVVFLSFFTIFSLEVTPFYPILLTSTLLVPVLYLLPFLRQIVNGRVPRTEASVISLTLLIFYIVDVSLVFAVLNHEFFNNLGALTRLLGTLLFNEPYFQEYSSTPYSLFNLAIPIWAILFAILFCITYNFTPIDGHSEEEQQFGKFPLKGIFLSFNNSRFWIVFASGFSVLSIMAANLKFDIEPQYFATPDPILAPIGNIFPLFTQVFPILPSLLVFIVIFITVYTKLFQKFDLSNVLLSICILGPVLLLSTAVLYVFMLLSSAEMTELNMLSKIVAFLFSKIILGVTHFFSLLGLSILLQKTLYIVLDP